MPYPYKALTFCLRTPFLMRGILCQVIMALTVQGLTGIHIICRHLTKARKAAAAVEAEEAPHPTVAVLVRFYICWLLLFYFML